MYPLFNINKRKELRDLLLSLPVDAAPFWGKMKLQQMVEHLVEQVEYSNGSKVFTCLLTPKEYNTNKQLWIYTDAVIPKNLILAPLPAKFRFSDTDIAVKRLLKELADFDQYFRAFGITADHLAYGPLNHTEWIVWHNKHFTHHLRQFNLM